jgi:hypothetical protein
MLLIFTACSSGGGGSNGDSPAVSAPQAGRLNATVLENTITLDWQMQGESFTITHSSSEARSIVIASGNQYTFSNLAPNSEHSFIVRSNTGEQALAYAYTGEMQAQPSKISAIAFDSSAEIAWEALPNVASYNLYRSVNEHNGYELIGTFRGSSALATGLNNGQAYYFKVAAKKATDSPANARATRGVPVGEDFGEITVVTPSTGGDDHPHIFKGYLRYGQYVQFMWDAVADAATNGYTVYSAPAETGPLEPMDYDCKLTLVYTDQVREETDVKRVTVYPASDPNEYLSVFVYERETDLRWDAETATDTYSVLLQTNGGNMEVIADGLSATEYTLENLRCDSSYVAYVLNEASYVLSSPVVFELDSGFCAINPDTGATPPSVNWPEGANRITVHPINDAPVSRGYYAATAYKDKMYMWGGNTSEVILWVFDPATFTWKQLNPTMLDGTPPSKGSNPEMVTVGDKIYLLGGTYNTAQVWEYDPNNGIEGSWHKKADEPSNPNNSHIGYGVVGTKIYTYSHGKFVLNVFDTSTGIWSTIAAPANGEYPSMIAIDNILYVKNANNKWYAYNTDEETWKTLASPSLALGQYVWFVEFNKKVYAFDDKIRVYDPATFAWETKIDSSPYITTPRTPVHIKGKFYIFSYGYSNSNDMVVYEP